MSKIAVVENKPVSGKVLHATILFVLLMALAMSFQTTANGGGKQFFVENEMYRVHNMLLCNDIEKVALVVEAIGKNGQMGGFYEITAINNKAGAAVCGYHTFLVKVIKSHEFHEKNWS